MRIFLCFFLGLCLALLWAGGARAQTFDPTTQCPGEASARADITKCFTNHEFGNCTTGEEPTCFTDNGYAAVMEGCTITDDASGSPSGDGYIECDVSTGASGFAQSYTLPALQDEISIRYYLYFSPGWADYWNNYPHGVFINATHDTGGACAGGGTIEMPSQPLANTTDTWETYFTGCSDAYIPVLDNITFNTGVWYLIEIYAKKDTSCTNNADADGCNGTLQIYVNGNLETNRTDINWVGGDITSSGFSSVQIPRMYFHGRGALWPQYVRYAGITIGDDADTRIQSDPSESLGSSSTTPHIQLSGVEPFVTSDTDNSVSDTTATSLASGNSKSRHTDADCTAPGGHFARGASSVTDGSATGFTVEYDSTLNRLREDWEALDLCSAANNPGGENYTPSDNSLKFTVANTTDYVNINYSAMAPLGGAGNWADTEYLFVGGDIYLHNGNDYTDVPILLGISGESSSTGASSNPNIFLSVSGGNLALVYIDPSYLSGARQVIGTAPTALTADTWYHIEIGLHGNDEATLSIDGTRVVDWTALPSQANFRVTTAFWGVSDYNQSGNFVVNYDNIHMSQRSRVHCDDGWGSDCPTAYMLGGNAAGGTEGANGNGGSGGFLSSIGIGR